MPPLWGILHFSTRTITCTCLLKLAKYFQSTWHFLVFFVPMSINDISHNSKLAKKANAIGGTDYWPKLLLHLLKYAEIVVGVKLHLSVLAASVYTPFVVFPYRLKGYDFVHSSNETMKLFVSGSENFKAIKQKVSVTLKRKRKYAVIFAVDCQCISSI